MTAIMMSTEGSASRATSSTAKIWASCGDLRVASNVWRLRFDVAAWIGRHQKLQHVDLSRLGAPPSPLCEFQHPIPQNNLPKSILWYSGFKVSASMHCI